MPFLLNIVTRAITKVDDAYGVWESVRVNAKRLISHSQHDIEWQYIPVTGLLSEDMQLLIVQDRDTAFDVEYYTREGTLQVSYGPPCPVVF